MKKIEFSKIALTAAIIIWIISVVLAWYYVFTRNAGLIEILTYIGSPVAVAYGFYSWKAKAENIIKIPALLKNNDMTKKAEKQVDESVEKALINGIAGVLKDVLHSESDTDEEV